MRTRFVAFAALFLLTALAGCNMPIYGSYYEERVERIAHILDPFEGGALLITLSPGQENVTVFACQRAQQNSLIDRLLSFFFDPGFVGASCGFYNLEDVSSNISQGELLPRALDIGVGLTILEFQEAAPYCNNSLRYAPSYIVGSDSGFLLPPRSLFLASQSCLAQHSIIPVYILATPDGKPPAVANEDELGEILNYNPSLVVYMRALNNSSVDRALLKERLSLLRSTCPRCLIGVGFAMGDMAWPKAIAEDEQLSSLIDFVAFGIEPTTPSGGALVGEALAYFGLLKSMLGKPILIHYTNLEDLSDYEARLFYSRMFSQLPILAPLGLIGYVAEPFYSEGPFTNSGLTMEGQPQQKKFSMFFAQCRHYYATQPPFTFFSPSGIPASPYAMQRFSYSQTTPQTEEAEPPYLIGETDKEEMIFDCNPCQGDAAAFLQHLSLSPQPVSPATCEEMKAKAAYPAALLYFDPAAVMALHNFYGGECHNRFVPPYQQDQCLFPRPASQVDSPLCQPTPQYLTPTGECSPSANGGECYICSYGPLEVPWPPGEASSLVKAICGENFDPYREEDAYCGAAVWLATLYQEMEEKVDGVESYYHIREESKAADLLTLTAIAYFHGKEKAEDFLYLVHFAGEATSCDYLSGDAYYFCCSYNEEGDMELNPMCGQQYSPAELFVKIHTTPLGGAAMPTWAQWRYETEKAFRYLQQYVSVAVNCKVCDKEGAKERYCKTLKRVYGYDVCSQVEGES